MKQLLLSSDVRDLVFRALFSSIFVGLGAEHIFDDVLILHLMPQWVLYPHLVSGICGLILLSGGLSILLGYRLKWGATMLGAFLIAVTVTVHLPGLFQAPQSISDQWLWTVFQRSNLVKNLCLFGVCVQLTGHRPGAYSFDARLNRSDS